MRRTFSCIAFGVTLALLRGEAVAQTGKFNPPSNPPSITPTPTPPPRNPTPTPPPIKIQPSNPAPHPTPPPSNPAPHPAPPPAPPPPPSPSATRTTTLPSYSGTSSTTTPLNFVGSRFPAALSNSGINPFPYSSGAFGPQYPSPWGVPSPWALPEPRFGYGMYNGPWAGGWGWNPMVAPTTPWMANPWMANPWMANPWVANPWMGGAWGAMPMNGFMGFGAPVANGFMPFGAPFGFNPNPLMNSFVQPPLQNLALNLNQLNP